MVIIIAQIVKFLNIGTYGANLIGARLQDLRMLHNNRIGRETATYCKQGRPRSHPDNAASVG